MASFGLHFIYILRMTIINNHQLSLGSGFCSWLNRLYGARLLALGNVFTIQTSRRWRGSTRQLNVADFDDLFNSNTNIDLMEKCEWCEKDVESPCKTVFQLAFCKNKRRNTQIVNFMSIIVIQLLIGIDVSKGLKVFCEWLLKCWLELERLSVLLMVVLLLLVRLRLIPFIVRRLLWLPYIFMVILWIIRSCTLTLDRKSVV